ncbi:MAG: glycosyltransferase family 2 protein [Culicoidibacterales bacterium]
MQATNVVAIGEKMGNLMKPEISIIVPIYNVEAYLQACLQSLVEQTQANLEIILVDDGSTDESSNIAEQFANQHDHLHYYHKLNGGLSDARNFGLKRAQGTYVAFMDSDDWVAPDYYAQLLQCAQDTHADLVCSDITYVYAEHEAIVKGSDFEGVIGKQDEQYPRYLLSTFPMAQNKLFKKAVIDDLKLQFPVGLLYEDVAFFYRIYPYLTKIAYKPIAGFYYRQRENSIMQAVSERVLEIEAVLVGIRQWYDERNLLSQYADEIEYSFARHLLFASYGRLMKSPDYQFAKESTRHHWELLNHYYPNWRKNRYWQDETLFRVKSQKVLYFGLTKWIYQLLVFALYKSKKIVSKKTVNK